MTDLELAQTRTAKGFVLLSAFFFLLIIPINYIATKEINTVSCVFALFTGSGL
jgi:hypothetical protein